MGQIQQPRPVLLLVAAFSRHPQAISWAQERCRQEFGPLGPVSDPFAFTETGYYARSMGEGLIKQFFSFQQLIDPGRLPEFKLRANAWEEEYRSLGGHSEQRPLNLDPGYLSEAKLVLASTKDHHHRLYLGGGVYGEVTLVFQRGQWRPRDWTYPDYQRPDYHAYFLSCRQWLRERYRGLSLTKPDSAP